MRSILALILLSLLAACASTSNGNKGAEESALVETLENVLRWSTATEVENFGYDVFRGESEDGPFERINATPIPGHGTTDVPQRYEYRDTSIEQHTAYYYFVESISLQGDRERFTPVFRVRPKRLQ